MNNYIVPERRHDAGGLVAYLFGPGRANEHRDQRVIAAAPAVCIADGTAINATDRTRVRRLARALDAPRVLLDVPTPRGHLWHCAISLPRGERLSDVQWAQVARTSVERLGFTAGSGRAACRWIAVHHGPGRGGCDHIHLVVGLVRRDGAIASTRNERRIMSRLCAHFERLFGLGVVDGRPGRGMPGYTLAEVERAHRAGRAEPDRQTLARIVRACLAVAADEVEWLQRLRGDVLARPRYAPCGHVIGYSVALPPAPGAKPVWFGGGRLAADLTLPRLRRHWTSPSDSDALEAARGQALAAWRGDDPAGRRPASYSPDAWRYAAAGLRQLHQHLASIPDGDTATWTATSSMVSGILATLSSRVEETPGVLAETADALARAAQTRRNERSAADPGIRAPMRTIAQVTDRATVPPHRPHRRTLLRHLADLVTLLGRKLAAWRPVLSAELRALAQRCLTLLKGARDATAKARPVDLEFPHPPAANPTGPGSARPPPRSNQSGIRRIIRYRDGRGGP